MCDGDFEAALQLAVGTPPPEERAQAERRQARLETMMNEPLTETELKNFARPEEARDERLDESPITTAADKFRTLAWAWFESNPDRVLLTSHPQLADALEIAHWDTSLIGAKIHRALHGHDEFIQGEGFEDDPVQSDWNGAAKIALISICRSIVSWTAIAGATRDPGAAMVAEELRRLQTDGSPASRAGFGFGSGCTSRPHFIQVLGSFTSNSGATGSVVFVDDAGCGNAIGIWNASKH